MVSTDFSWIKTTYGASVSSLSLFEQFIPLHPEHMIVHSMLAFLHLQFLLHPCLQPQLIMRSTLSGAADWSLMTGILATRWSHPVYILATPWSLPGHLLPYPEHVLAIPWSPPGHIMAIFRWNQGHIQAMSSPHRNHILATSLSYPSRILVIP